jgi:V/A-type H+-transporting ATPase subunit I
MLRPERMSRVSVTGSKSVMDDVIETIYDLELLHVTEYDGSWEVFEPGTPLEGGEEASEKLVTVRSLESILDVDEADAGRQRIITEEALAEQLEEIRQEVNELDDERNGIEDELRTVEEDIDAMEPFVELGIDLDLLRDYDSLSVAVGEADEASVREALSAAAVDAWDIWVADGVVAAVAQTDEETLQEALVDAAFTAIDVPDGDGDPEAYLEELRHRKQKLESQLSTVEDQLEDIKLDAAGFLLAAEEQLSIEVQKTEAPLTFATTDNAFVAEGWIPTERVDEFTAALRDAVGDHVAVDELEVAEYDGDGHAEATEPAGSDHDTGATAETPTTPNEPTADGDTEADDGTDEPTRDPPEQARADGGVVTMGAATPPVIQDNSGPAKPFEALVEVINRPKYSELDPTILLFLTFPVFFGFMIGDLGYGILYAGIGYWMIRRFDSDVLKSLGGVAMWAGGFTALFGVLYGEVFGLHQLGEIVWGTKEQAGVVGQLFEMHGPPIHKGLQPHFIYYAYAWLLVSVIVGVLHLVVGRIFDFRNNLAHHGLREAFVESGSWIILTGGLWWWVFTRTATGPKPNFMFSVFANKGMTHPITGETIKNVALPLGFTGIPVIELFRLPVGGFDFVVGAALATLFVGLGLVVYAEGGIGLIESITQAFGHVVSYTRIAAVLLAKAGMALVVNLLVFGAELKNGEFHFIFFMDKAPSSEHVVFAGLVNGDTAVMLVLGWIAGLIVLVFGHLLVLVLGITSAGLQAIRLEYVEFFGKFYEGGGKPYSPFGYERDYTTEQ